jgi:hypothetical protein
LIEASLNERKLNLNPLPRTSPPSEETVRTLAYHSKRKGRKNSIEKAKMQHSRIYILACSRNEISQSSLVFNSAGVSLDSSLIGGIFSSLSVLLLHSRISVIYPHSSNMVVHSARPLFSPPPFCLLPAPFVVGTSDN